MKDIDQDEDDDNDGDQDKDEDDAPNRRLSCVVRRSAF